MKQTTNTYLYVYMYIKYKYTCIYYFLYILDCDARDERLGVKKEGSNDILSPTSLTPYCSLGSLYCLHPCL